MTLYKQIFVFLSLLIVGLFTAALLVNLNSSRTFLAEQFESHAQDTATSLGVLLSAYVQNEDIPIMGAMVNAVFDRGYYREISVYKNDGQPLVERNLQVTIEDVPKWFIRWIPLEAPRVSAKIMAGWTPVGVVFVRSHPGYAYLELWQTATRTLLWFTGFGLIAVLLVAFKLKNILRPLQAVEHQAESLHKKQYVIQEELPRTRELRSVVLAMNRMTNKVKSMFEEQSRTTEQLRDQAFFDSVTGLGNRRRFDNFLQTQLKSPRTPQHGTLMLVHLRVLNDTNEKQGYERGDELLRSAAKHLLETISGSDTAIVARLSGADFGLLLPAVNLEESEKIAARICTNLAHLYSESPSQEPDIVNVGVTNYTHGQMATDVLARADLALRSSQADGSNSWSCSDDADAIPFVMSRQAWRKHLTDVIARKDVLLFVQPVVDITTPDRVLHTEVLVRISGDNDQLWRAGDFMPVAERIGLVEDLDRVIFAEGLNRLSRVANSPAWAINISPISLRDGEFVTWMLNSLSTISAPHPKIIFEFAESGAVLEIDRLHELAGRLRSLGHSLAVDHFGSGRHPFGYLQTLRPDYVKIDATLTDSIGDDRDKQFFVASLSKVAHSLDITVIAEAVESQEEWDTLKQLHVDGVQGYAVGHPRPIEEWQNKAAT